MATASSLLHELKNARQGKVQRVRQVADAELRGGPDVYQQKPAPLLRGLLSLLQTQEAAHVPGLSAQRRQLPQGTACAEPYQKASSRKASFKRHAGVLTSRILVLRPGLRQRPDRQERAFSKKQTLPHHLDTSSSSRHFFIIQTPKAFDAGVGAAFMDLLEALAELGYLRRLRRKVHCQQRRGLPLAMLLPF